MIGTVIIFGLGTVVGSFVLTGAVMRVLPPLGLVSTPDPNHPDPVPVGGGIAIWLTLGIALVVLAGTGHDVAGVTLPLVGASVLFVAGLWDDVRLLEPGAKLFVQIGAAAAMVIGGVTFPLGAEWEWLAVPLTMLWFVGVCNAFNLIDNMDGMLPGVAAVAAVFVGVFAYATGRPETALVSWIVAAAVLGFLPFNLPPARIFMGDAGSMGVGFLLAGLAIGESWAGLTQLAFTILAPSLLLAVPIFNTTFVTITRKMSGVPLSRGKGDHINYRLLAHGLGRTRALLTVYLLSAVSGTVGVLVVTSTPLAYAVGASLFLILLMYLGVFLYEGRVQDFEDSFRVPREKPGWEQSPWYRWVIRIGAMAGDVVLVFASMYLAFYLRFDGAIPDRQLRNLAVVLPYLLVVRVGIALVMGVYETQWRFSVAKDTIRLVGSVVLGSLIFTAILFLLRPPSFPRAVVAIEGLLALGFFGLTRVGVRELGEAGRHEWAGDSGRRTIVVGTAQGIASLVHRHGILRGGYHVLGVACDDIPAKRTVLAGLRVLGPTLRVPVLAHLYGAEHVVLCFPGRAAEELAQRVRGILKGGVTVEVARVEFVPGEEWLARYEEDSAVAAGSGLPAR